MKTSEIGPTLLLLTPQGTVRRISVGLEKQTRCGARPRRASWSGQYNRTSACSSYQSVTNSILLVKVKWDRRCYSNIRDNFLQFYGH